VTYPDTLRENVTDHLLCTCEAAFTVAAAKKKS